MAAKIAINGFGRIGRYLVQLIANDPELDVAVINARADNPTLAHLLKYDSCYGAFPGEVAHNDRGLVVNGKQILVTRDGLGEWKWADLGIDVAVETTGKLKDRAALQQHIDCGARKTVVSAPAKGVDLTTVMGVNDDLYDPVNHHVVSNASCTTNCLAPSAKVLHETFGLVHGFMTTIHSYTMSQRILDGSHKDLRRARAAGMSLIPTSTGAAKAVGEVIPALKGKLDGISVRVPTPNCSMVDLVCELSRTTTVEEVNAALKAAATQGPLKDALGYSDEPLVSIDYLGSTYGGVVDGLSTMVLDNKLIKLIIWYDNEAGFTNQLVRLLRKMTRAL